MTALPSSNTPEQVVLWLRALLTVAWADGNFDPSEQTLLRELVQQQLAPDLDLSHFQPVTLTELETGFAGHPDAAENFLRTAVMVALADGMYSSAEDELLQQFCQALKIQVNALTSLRLTLDGQDGSLTPTDDRMSETFHLLDPVRRWLDDVEVHDPQVARFLCKLIPAQCPFERDVVLFGHKVVHIPPLCKLNPLYEQLVGLRFRSLSYLADECQEDVSAYC